MSLALAAVATTAHAADEPAVVLPNSCTPPSWPMPTFADRTISVRDQAATGDGHTNDSAAVQRAIAACSAAGGGVVLFPPGTYAIASVQLQSHVKLQLDAKATLIGCPGAFAAPEPNPFSKYQDPGHSHFHNAMLWGDDLHDVEITGGAISGGSAVKQNDKGPAGVGNKLIAVRTGSNLFFHDIVHPIGGHFVYLLNDCRNVTFAHITIKKSRDAIDLMGCSNVAVHDCNFTGCVDDTLGIKSDFALGRKIDSANIYAWDDYFESGCNGVNFGSETAGDFHNVNVWNLRIGLAMKAGLGITTCDGGIVDGVRFDHITIRHAANPIFLLVNNRLRTGVADPHSGEIRNVTLSNVDITDMTSGRQGPVNPATLSGLPNAHLCNVTLSNIHIHYPGNGTADEATITPPYPRDYSPRSMGSRPASAMYLRNADNITLQNVQFDFDHPDPRPPLVVSNVDGLILNNVTVAFDPAAGPLAVLHGVQHLQVVNSPQFAATNAIEQTPSPAEPTNPAAQPSARGE